MRSTSARTQTHGQALRQPASQPGGQFINEFDSIRLGGAQAAKRDSLTRHCGAVGARVAVRRPPASQKAHRHTHTEESTMGGICSCESGCQMGRNGRAKLEWAPSMWKHYYAATCSSGRTPIQSARDTRRPANWAHWATCSIVLGRPGRLRLPLAATGGPLCCKCRQKQDKEGEFSTHLAAARHSRRPSCGRPTLWRHKFRPPVFAELSWAARGAPKAEAEWAEEPQSWAAICTLSPTFPRSSQRALCTVQWRLQCAVCAVLVARGIGLPAASV